MLRNVRALALALVLVFVSASAAQALPLDSSSGMNVVDRVLSWIGTLLSPVVPDVTSIWEMAGSQMDPNGQPQNNTWPAPTTEEGSSMDPNGRP